MLQSNFQPGQVVKYSNPLSQKEVEARFTVKEISPANGNMNEKLTVEFICNMNIKPVSTFFSTEFAVA